MKLFLDTVDIIDVIKYKEYIDGITTNPSLVAKAIGSSKDKVHQFWNQIFNMDFEGGVSVQVLSSTTDAMLEDAKYILDYVSKIVGNLEKARSKIVIKIPLTWEGLNACKELVSKGCRVNMTLCFSSAQALLAAKAGATYVSPFVGRMQDQIGNDAGFKLISDIRTIYDHYKWPKDNPPTKILASSIRQVDHIAEVASRGADLATIPVSIMSKLLEHDLSATGLDNFKSDAIKFSLQNIMPID